MRELARQSRRTASAQQPAIAALATVRTVALISAATLALYPALLPVRRRRAANYGETRRGDTAIVRSAQVKVPVMASGSLVVKITAGKNDPERCNQALTVAATAVVSGVPVSLWLTGEAAWLGLPGRAAEIALPHASPAGDLLATIVGAGTVTVCTQCAARRGITEQDLIAGVRIAGATTFIAEVLADGAKPLVY